DCEWLRKNYLHGIHADFQNINWLKVECEVYKENCDVLKVAEAKGGYPDFKGRCPDGPLKTPSVWARCYRDLITRKTKVFRPEVVEAFKEDCYAQEVLGIKSPIDLSCHVIREYLEATCKKDDDCVQVIQKCMRAPSNLKSIERVRSRLASRLMRARC